MILISLNEPKKKIKTWVDFIDEIIMFVSSDRCFDVVRSVYVFRVTSLSLVFSIVLMVKVEKILHRGNSRQLRDRLKVN